MNISFLDSLLLPFQFEFMTDAFILGMCISLLCSLFSCFLILKGQSLIGDALSHSVLPGIIIAHALKIPLTIGAFASGIFSIYATKHIRDRSSLKDDTILGVVFTGLFALGLVLFAKIPTDLHLDHILFGNILGIERTDFWEALIICFFCFLFFIFYFRSLTICHFDEVFARTIGMNTSFFRYALLVLVALLIITSIKALGILLVIALLITPGCTGHLLTKKMGHMLFVSAIVGVLACLLGIYISFFIDASPSASIVLVQTSLLVILVGIGKLKKLISNSIG